MKFSEITKWSQYENRQLFIWYHWFCYPWPPLKTCWKNFKNFLSSSAEEVTGARGELVNENLVFNSSTQFSEIDARKFSICKFGDELILGTEWGDKLVTSNFQNFHDFMIPFWLSCFQSKNFQKCSTKWMCPTLVMSMHWCRESSISQLNFQKLMLGKFSTYKFGDVNSLKHYENINQR